MQLFILRTGQGPLGVVWAFAYRLWARLFLFQLLRGEREVSAYRRAPGDSFIPGLSDVDLMVVVARDGGPSGSTVERIRRRARRLRLSSLHRRVPIIDDPLVLAESELRELAGRSALTVGRSDDASEPEPRVGDGAPVDAVRMLIRPGLISSFERWERLSGADRLPREPIRDAQQRRIAAWFDLQFWWGVLPRPFIAPAGPRPADVCIKCVAEAIRIWSALAPGATVPTRVDALACGLELFPEEEPALRQILELRRTLTRGPDPMQALEAAVPLFVRLSRRIAATIDADLQGASGNEVRLLAGGSEELVLAGGPWKPNPLLPGGRSPRILPLADWRGVACPAGPDDAFAVLSADITDPYAHLAAAALNQGPYPTLCDERLLIRPSTGFVRSRLRSVECPATDPVSFALISRQTAAFFPEVPGWAAGDVAHRAVAEHRVWLQPPRGAPGARDLGMLISAARAGLFLQSIRDGQPELPLTLSATARMLAARSSALGAIADEALHHYRIAVHNRAGAPRAQTEAMRELVRALPAYRGGA